MPSEPAVKNPGAPAIGVSDVLAAGWSPYFVCCPSVCRDAGNSARNVCPLCSRIAGPALETIASTSAAGNLAEGAELGLPADGNPPVPPVAAPPVLDAAEPEAELLVAT